MLLALAVLITMGRLALFLQPRCGRGGLVFRVIKFRTTRPAAFFGPHLTRAAGKMKADGSS
jgi:lipopolysaccharide/colanic/teichoic acid biosynthesis glycosyltransferase